MYGAHHLDELSLRVVLADNVVVTEEVRRDGHERVLGPALEPVDRAARDEAGELERARPELLANLTPTSDSNFVVQTVRGFDNVGRSQFFHSSTSAPLSSFAFSSSEFLSAFVLQIPV